MNKPLVSVIMSVYNTKEIFLKEAIMSILEQSYTHFEFIIIDDASDKKIQPLIEDIKDPRIQLYRNKDNIGLTKSLNIAIDVSKGKYIARMDSDDISFPDRLKKQVEYLEKHTDIGVLGTYALLISNKKRTLKMPTAHEDIKAGLILDSQMIHPTVMIRRKLLTKNVYNERFIVAQDYELWSRLIWETKFANLDRALLKLRMHDGQISVTKSDEQHKMANKIRETMIIKINNKINKEKFNKIQIKALSDLSNQKILLELQEFSNELISLNKESKAYSGESLTRVLSRNLDRANYTYAMHTRSLPMRKLHISPEHKRNRYSYQKYIGPIFGPKGFPF